MRIGRRNLVSCVGLVLLGLSVFPQYAASEADLYRHLDFFGDVLERVRSNYVDKPSDEKLIHDAIIGALLVADPDNVYLDREQWKAMQTLEESKGAGRGGLGLEFTMENGSIKIISAIDGTPASDAGIRAGDIVTHINDEEIKNASRNDAKGKLTGAEGDQLRLTIIRKNLERPIELTLTRAAIALPTLTYRIDKDVGLVRIPYFTKNTAKKLEAAIMMLKSRIGEDLKGYVLDLRNNPGGHFDQAIAVADLFLDTGAIVLTRGRNGEQTGRIDATPGKIAKGTPMVVLVNGGTASAAEIVAGALQDHKRATVIGVKSAGWGKVRTIIPLSAKMGAIRIVTAHRYTPSGKSITALGIKPDIKVINTDRKRTPDLEDDDQIMAALTFLREGPKGMLTPGTHILGMVLTSPTTANRNQAGFKENVKGALVAAVKPGGPADKANIKPGMVIHEANQDKVTGPEDIARIVKQQKQQLRKSITVLIRDRTGRFKFFDVNLQYK